MRTLRCMHIKGVCRWGLEITFFFARWDINEGLDDVGTYVPIVANGAIKGLELFLLPWCKTRVDATFCLLSFTCMYIMSVRSQQKHTASKDRLMLLTLCTIINLVFLPSPLFLALVPLSVHSFQHSKMKVGIQTPGLPGNWRKTVTVGTFGLTKNLWKPECF